MSPTSFSWGEVKRYCVDNLNLKPPPSETELPGSFRLTRPVAAIAGELFHKSVSASGKFREAPRAELDSLPTDGEVRVMVVPNAARRVGAILRRFDGGVFGEGRLQLIVQEQSEALIEVAEDSHIDLLTPRLAKGLEFESVGVIEPFGGSGERLSFAQATVAYTSLTRAVRKLLCILAPPEWNLVAPRWRPHGIQAEILSDAAEDELRLEKTLLQMVGDIDVGEYTALLESRLRAELEGLPSSGSTIEADKHLRRLIDWGRQLVRLSRIETLGDEFGGALAPHGWVVKQARAALAGDGAWAGKVALAILLGEFATAADIVDRQATIDEAKHLTPALERLVEKDGACQRACRTLRRSIHFSPEVTGNDMLRLTLAVASVGVAQRVPLPTLEV